MVYHGTTADFDEFRRGKQGSYGPGIYFVDSKSYADTFASGGTVKEVHLAIAKPFNADTATTKEFDAFLKKKDPVAAFKKAGYDGIIGRTTGVYVAFEPTQIRLKSPKITESQ
mgnify:FL=1